MAPVAVAREAVAVAVVREAVAVQVVKALVYLAVVLAVEVEIAAAQIQKLAVSFCE